MTTTSRVAQEYFDQGLDFLYGFNHDEAIRSFEAAAAADPHCAMAYWGIAAANGPHINNPNVDEASRQGSLEGARQGPRVGGRRVARRSGSDRSDGQALRRDAAADRHPLDVAYADAMQKVWDAHSDDPTSGR